MTYLKTLWSKVPEAWRKEATSFAHTFIGTLVVTVGFQINAGQISWTKEALVALAVAALRSAWKAAFNKVVLKK